MSMSSSQSHREHTGSCASWVRYSLHEGERAPQERWGPHSTRVRGPIRGSGFGWVDLGRCQAAGVCSRLGSPMMGISISVLSRRADEHRGSGGW